MSHLAIGKADRTLDVASWLPADEWRAAPEFVRKQLIDFAVVTARNEKLDQLGKGYGADGKRLPRVLPSSRPDRAKGPALSPHLAGSRSFKWLRFSGNARTGRLVWWWSHGWQTILNYHAEGRVIGAYIRNVVEFHASAERRIQRAVVEHWRALVRTYGLMFGPRGGGPPTMPPATPALPAMPRMTGRQVAARPFQTRV